MLLILLNIDNEEHFELFEDEESLQEELYDLYLFQIDYKVKSKEVLCNNTCNNCPRDSCCKSVAIWI